MQERAISDLANKWIEEDINAPYFKGVKQRLKSESMAKLSDEMALFLQYVIDLDDALLEEIGAYYEIPEEDMNKALVVRLKAAKQRAREYRAEHESSELDALMQELCEKGMNGRECELWIARVRKITG